MTFEDPIRLSSAGSNELRKLLDSAAGDAPSHAQLASLTAKLAPALGAAAAGAAANAAGTGAHASVSSGAAGTSAGSTAAAVGAKAVGLKAIVAILAVTGGAAVATVAWRRAEHRSPPPAQVALAPPPPHAAAPSTPAVPAPSPSPALAPSPSPSLPASPSPSLSPSPPRPTHASSTAAIATSVPAPSSAPRPSHRAPIRRAPAEVVASSTPESAPADVSAPASPPASAAATPPSEPGDDAVQEYDLVDSAQKAMRAGDWQRVLELVGSRAELFPKGMFAEEGERIAIEALAQLGRTDEARARLQRFNTAYPNSTYRERLVRLLGTGSH